MHKFLYGVRNPAVGFRGINRRFRWRDPINSDGIKIFDTDWDVLVILDACRFDSFKEEIETRGWKGNLERVESRASSTHDWVVANFTGRNATDCVYLTANPWYEQLSDSLGASLHAVNYLYRDDDSQHGASPEFVTNAALEAAKEYPNKRLLIHYLQPHEPYIGEYGEEAINNQIGMQEAVKELPRSQRKEIIRRAYRENLSLVLDSLDSLIDSVQGKIVISADHGELLGERYLTLPVAQYNHHSGIFVDELIDVPWFVPPFDERRTIQHDETTSLTTDRSSEVKKRLENLGYR